MVCSFHFLLLLRSHDSPRHHCQLTSKQQHIPNRNDYTLLLEMHMLILLGVRNLQIFQSSILFSIRDLQHECLKPLLISSLNDISNDLGGHDMSMSRSTKKSLNILDVGFRSGSIIKSTFDYFEMKHNDIKVNIHGFETQQEWHDCSTKQAFFESKIEPNQLFLHNIDTR